MPEIKENSYVITLEDLLGDPKKFPFSKVLQVKWLDIAEYSAWVPILDKEIIKIIDEFKDGKHEYTEINTLIYNKVAELRKLYPRLFNVKAGWYDKQQHKLAKFPELLKIETEYYRQYKQHETLLAKLVEETDKALDEISKLHFIEKFSTRDFMHISDIRAEYGNELKIGKLKKVCGNHLTYNGSGYRLYGIDIVLIQENLTKAWDNYNRLIEPVKEAKATWAEYCNNVIDRLSLLDESYKHSKVLEKLLKERYDNMPRDEMYREIRRRRYEAKYGTVRG